MKLFDKFKNVFTKTKEEQKEIQSYEEGLQKTRKELLKKLKKYGNLMKPMNYVKNKHNIQKTVELLNKNNFNYRK